MSKRKLKSIDLLTSNHNSLIIKEDSASNKRVRIAEPSGNTTFTYENNNIEQSSEISSEKNLVDFDELFNSISKGNEVLKIADTALENNSNHVINNEFNENSVDNQVNDDEKLIFDEKFLTIDESEYFNGDDNSQNSTVPNVFSHFKSLDDLTDNAINNFLINNQSEKAPYPSADPPNNRSFFSSLQQQEEQTLPIENKTSLSSNKPNEIILKAYVDKSGDSNSEKQLTLEESSAKFPTTSSNANTFKTPTIITKTNISNAFSKNPMIEAMNNAINASTNSDINSKLRENLIENFNGEVDNEDVINIADNDYDEDDEYSEQREDAEEKRKEPQQPANIPKNGELFNVDPKKLNNPDTLVIDTSIITQQTNNGNYFISMLIKNSVDMEKLTPAEKSAHEFLYNFVDYLNYKLTLLNIDVLNFGNDANLLKMAISNLIFLTAKDKVMSFAVGCAKSSYTLMFCILSIYFDQWINKRKLEQDKKKVSNNNIIDNNTNTNNNNRMFNNNQPILYNNQVSNSNQIYGNNLVSSFRDNLSPIQQQLYQYNDEDMENEVRSRFNNSSQQLISNEVGGYQIVNNNAGSVASGLRFQNNNNNIVRRSNLQGIVFQKQ